MHPNSECDGGRHTKVKTNVLQPTIAERYQWYVTNFRSIHVNNSLVVSSYYTIYCVDHETARYVETPRALSEAISRTREPRVILNFSKLSLAKPTSLIVDITRRGMGA